MNDKKIPNFLTIEDVASLAHCSIRHVHEEKKRGVLRCHKMGRRLVFSEEDVVKWINRKTQVA